MKVALANFRRHKLHAIITIFGLATGLASCILIMLFIRHELSYDTAFPNADSLYRLSADFAATAQTPARSPAGNIAPLAPLIGRSDIDGIKAVARIGGMHALLSRDETVFYEDGFRWADPALFQIFQFQWVHGSPDTALTQPDTVVLSESVARKYFGQQNPMGQILLLENSVPISVVGVIEDIPENSHLRADLLVPMETAWKLLGNYENNWSYSNFHTYLSLESGASIEDVADQIKRVIDSSLENTNASNFGVTPDTFSFTAYNIQDVHLQSARVGEFKEPGDMAFIFGFGAIAAGLLLIACINFMNLSTAQGARRSKEVGMRKVMGASRGQLISQFLGESLLMTFIALALGLVLVELIRPVFGALVERQLESTYLLAPDFILLLLGITFFTALLAGSYPAFVLSAFSPARVFKAAAGKRSSGLTVRNVLVVLQFFLAISLIVVTTVVYLQMRFTRDADLGFDKNNVVVLWGTHSDGMGLQWDALKQELLTHPEVSHVTEGDMHPNSAAPRQVRIAGGPAEGLRMQTKPVGFGFFETYGIELVAGRDFDEARASDIFYPPPNVPAGEQPTGSYILNETAVRELGWTPEEATGRTFEVDFSNDFSLAVTGPVIGVAEDIHFQSLREPIQPLVWFVPAPMWGAGPTFNVASVRVTGSNLQPTVDYINEQWRRFIPEIPLSYHFLNTEFEALYQDEERQGQLFTLFAVLTVLIACLGLFGLATFVTEQRRKEIGVRKVVGGTVWSIVLLLTGHFSKLVLISNIMAWPVAYLLMSRWLESFAYRIDLTPLLFIGSGAVALSLAWATVGGTVARAARKNPVMALRYE